MNPGASVLSSASLLCACLASSSFLYRLHPYFSREGAGFGAGEVVRGKLRVCKDDEGMEENSQQALRVWQADLLGCSVELLYRNAPSMFPSLRDASLFRPFRYGIPDKKYPRRMIYDRSFIGSSSKRSIRLV
jgi:hypothetical protein